jgi:hypothetical protein
MGERAVRTPEASSGPVDDELEADLARVDQAIGASLRGAIIGTLRLGHTNMRSTMRDYTGVRPGDDIARIVKYAVLGDAAAIEREFPELVALWHRRAADSLDT